MSYRARGAIGADAKASNSGFEVVEPRRIGKASAQFYTILLCDESGAEDVVEM